ncbi:MAG: AI-2E family transporter [Actinobacteria bacterium]|nr:AI-2E family transporter [Actinomycetota bacterium]
MKSPIARLTRSTSADGKSSSPVKSLEDFGVPGSPINTAHPFYFGFLAASGAVIAITLLRALASASDVFILLIISIYLAAGLNPAIEFFVKRGLRRGLSIFIVALSVIATAFLFIILVIPPVIRQVDLFIQSLPETIQSLTNNRQIARLNDQYQVIDNLVAQAQEWISGGQLFATLYGGVIGVGKTVLSGTFALLTVFVLTLYFMAALPKFLSVIYRLAPASRRNRVSAIGDAITNRIGIFVGSQILIAATAALFITLYGLILDIPYAAALGMVVFFAGLIPLVGHFIGATIFTLVALTQSLGTAIAALVGYAIYQQIENYLVMPRIMKRSLSIPGIVTIVAALLGSALFGLIGAILAVPMAAALLLILEEVVFPKSDRS